MLYVEVVKLWILHDHWILHRTQTEPQTFEPNTNRTGIDKNEMSSSWTELNSADLQPFEMISADMQSFELN